LRALYIPDFIKIKEYGDTVTLSGDVFVEKSLVVPEGGEIYGKAESLPAGADASLANSSGGHYYALSGDDYRDRSDTMKWGTGCVNLGR
jgi:hypothetical protein